MRNTILFILLFIAYNSFGQVQTLSKKELYSDFEQLIRIITEANPQIEARKAVTGLDQMREINNIYQNIDTVTSDQGFYKLLNLALAYVRDDHSKETYYYYYDIDILDNIDTTFLNQKKEMMPVRKKTVSNFPITALYFDDSYYLIGNHILISDNKKDTLLIQCLKINSFNDQDFYKYIQSNYILPKFDYVRRKYYKDWISLPGSGLIKGEQYGRKIEFRIEEYSQRILSSMVSKTEYDVLLNSVPRTVVPFEFQKTKKANFFEKDSILYIYMDRMIEDEKFYEFIKETGKDKKINKIIVDVRGNPGGSDYAWHNLLKIIIKDTLFYNIKLAYKDSPTMNNQLGHYPDNGTETISWLGNNTYKLIVDSIQIVPDENSLNFDGNIFILADRDTYSSGFSFINCAEQIDRLISIGEPSGQIRGMGINPQLFQLKHSKFTFRMACVIDIYNANKAIDVYKDFPEIIVYPGFEEYLIYPRMAYDIKSEEYLRHFDSMFKWVLNNY